MGARQPARTVASGGGVQDQVAPSVHSAKMCLFEISRNAFRFEKDGGDFAQKEFFGSTLLPPKLNFDFFVKQQRRRWARRRGDDPGRLLQGHRQGNEWRIRQSEWPGRTGRRPIFAGLDFWGSRALRIL